MWFQRLRMRFEPWTDPAFQSSKSRSSPRTWESEREVHGYVTAGDVAKGRGPAPGLGWAGFFGLLFGAAFLWVPGFGPLLVAGPLSAALLGGVEGALAGAAGGGLLGALFGWGVSRQHILKYEERVKGRQVPGHCAWESRPGRARPRRPADHRA